MLIDSDDDNADADATMKQSAMKQSTMMLTVQQESSPKPKVVEVAAASESVD